MIDLVFERGYYVDSSLSVYTDYRRKDYNPLARELIRFMGIESHHRVLDFGCALGLLVKAFLDNGIPFVVGTDISFWGINWGRRNLGLDKSNIQHYNRQLLEWPFEHVLFLDIVEHIPTIKELDCTFDLLKADKVGLRIPVSDLEGGEFLAEVHKKDRTHYQCHTKNWWHCFMERHGYIHAKTMHGKEIYDTPEMFCRVYKRAVPCTT